MQPDKQNDLKIELKLVQELQPHPQNARTHTKHQIRQIAESIRFFGFTNPVLVDGTSRIIAGHGRVAAAKLLGIKEVPAIVTDRFGVSLKLPSVISDDDLDALIQLRRIATGEEFEADTISATMAKDRSLQEGILSGSNKRIAPLRFGPQSDADPIEIFGAKVFVGRPVFECTKVELEEPSITRERYVAASDGDSIPIVWRCLGRCRFFYGSPLDPLAQNNPPIDGSSGADSIPRTDR